MDRPAARLRIQEVEIIFALGDTVMMNALDNREIVVITRQIEVRAPPFVGRMATVIASKKCVKVLLVGEAAGPTVFQFTGAALHFEQISVGQVMLLQKPAAHFLDSEINAPKIAGVLVARIGFIRLVDDSEVNPMGVGRLNSRQIKELECHGLEHPVLTAMTILSL